MGSGTDQYWRAKKESKDTKLINSVLALTALLMELDIIKKDYYVAYYGKVAWHIACKDFVGRNWPA